MHTDWRTAVFNRVAITTSLALFIVTLFVLTEAILEGRNIFTPGTLIVITTSLLTIPIALFNTDTRLRASLEVVILLTIGLFVAYKIGLEPGPSIALAIAVVLAAIFLGAGVGLAALLLTILSLIGIGWLYATGSGSPGSGAVVSTSLQEWVVESGIFGTLTGVLVILIAHVVNTIEGQTRELEQTLEQLGQTQTALTEAKRIEGLGRLAAGIAHDFNNTLHVVMSWASILEETEDEKTRRDGVAAIQSASKKASTLTGKLLSLGRNRLQKPATTYPRLVLEELGKSTTNILPTDIDLQLDLIDTPAVFVDPAELEQLVLNLVINARDAMPRGGTLTIGLGLENKSLQAGREQSSCVHIWVTDTGIGMDQTTLNSIFDPFFTTKGDLGTGLGLSSAYTFAESSNGSLVAESEPLIGTTIHLYLPLSGANEKQANASTLERSIEGRRVLYTEDKGTEDRGTEDKGTEDNGPETEELLHPTMEKAFSTAGVDVVRVLDLVAAARSLDQNKAPFDLLYINANDPNESAKALIKKFSIHSPTAKILLLAEQVPDPHMRRDIALGKIEYLKKPCQPAALIQKATSLLQELA